MTSTVSGQDAATHRAPRPIAFVPNAISAVRLAAAPVLLFYALGRHQRAFAWLLLACLLSDIADGLIARAFRAQSRLGAALDSTADFLVTIIGAAGIVTMQWPFVAAHAWELGILVALLVGEYGISFWRYGRLSSFHTYLVRVGAYLQGAFFVGLFFWGYQAALFYSMWVVCCAAQVEEWILLALLPEWTPDVRGVYWVLKGRRH
jgi:cardiolipin synthase